VIALALVAAAVAQAPSLDDLCEEDWRQRNRSAQALAAGGEIDVDFLLKIAAGKTDHVSEEDPPRDWNTAVGLGPDPSPLDKVLENPRWKLRTHHGRGTGIRHPRHPENFAAPWPTRTLAVWLIGARPVLDPRAVELCAHLVEQHAHARLGVQAAWSLVRLGDPARDALRLLLRRPETASSIAIALSAAGDKGCAELAAHLDGDDPVSRKAAVGELPEEWLRAHPEALGRVAEMFLHEEDELAARAGDTMWRMPGETLPLLRNALERGDVGARTRAVGMAFLFEEKAAPLLDALLALITDADPLVRQWAIRAAALAAGGNQSATRVAAALRPLLRAEDRADRAIAMAAFGDLGDAVTAADRSLLVAATQADDAAVQVAALRSLDRLEALREVPLPAARALAGMPWAHDVEARALAAHGAAALDDLEDWVWRTSGEWQRWMVRSACERLGPGAREGLQRWIDGDDPDTRAAGVRGMSGFRTARDEAIGDVRRLLEDEAAEVRGEAVRWLARLEPADDADLALLTKALVDRHEDVRDAAAAALRWRPLAPEFYREVLVPLLTSTPMTRRTEVAHLLLQAPVGDPGLTELLVGIVRESPGDDHAVRALGQVGAVTDAVRETLQQAYDRRLWDYRPVVVDALFDLHARR
jgi:hypothetical protein